LRYAKIAEAAPHAQHMPSHIFTRVGYWKESVESNRNAAKLAKAGKEGDDELHASDYMVYAYLQLARDQEAREVIEAMGTIGGYNPDRNTGPFALAASPARYAVERGDWTGAAQLQPRPSKFGYVEAITHFARALGAARSGNPDAAKADIVRLGELRDKLREGKDAYWSEQVDIQGQVAAAWALYAAGAHAEALNAMAAAADAEDKTEKATVTPGPLAPARELQGEMLLERGMAKEALSAFEATMAKEPNRYRGLAGAARAAELLGDTAKAKTYYGRLVALAGGGDGDRRELAAAKQFLAKH
jgi:tetratricopeptide (TPR) repeat protein